MAGLLEAYSIMEKKFKFMAELDVKIAWNE